MRKKHYQSTKYYLQKCRLCVKVLCPMKIKGKKTENEKMLSEKPWIIC